jgi:hypothetical protein
VFDALGLQRHFEEQLAEDSDGKMRLDAYLGEKIRETLRAWNRTDEDRQEPEEEEGYMNKEEGAEVGSEEWLDEEGYWNILLPRASGDNESSVV